MELFLDPDDPSARVMQLYEQVRTAIAEGRLAPGDRLTPSRTVAAALGVSRTTVTEAYGRLSAEGYIEGRSARGSVVSAAPPHLHRDPRVAALRPTRRAAGIVAYDSDPAADGMFDFRAGRLDRTVFPARAWRRSVLRSLERAPAHYADPAGTPELRAVLANWVARSRGVTASAEEVFVTAGAGHAVDLVARVLVDPGATVAVEEPGYPPVLSLLRSQGLHVVTVPVDEGGIVVEALPPRTRLVYVTPSHQFPLGMVMARSRRLQLLAWAARSGAAIVEDDYDSEFRHTARPLEPLQRLDRDGRVVYVGTFSKCLSPALRVGFMVVPRTLVPTLRAVRQAIDWCPPVPAQAALTHFVGEGRLDQHLRRSRRVFGRRRQVLLEALERALPPGYRRLPSDAGLHVTVTGPEDPDDEGLALRLRRHGVLVSSLRRTYATTPAGSGLILGFAGLPDPLVVPAVDALSAALTRRSPRRVLKPT
ncbi:PLP-dependent aminotransferase family protein [Dactylosporangium sp. NBC_01737]|uniref:MocR-like pyridoxine biosynthesis transcription factor PdxR n=1 Tax=Dactylosporangium sp. NBC_01737 TaxID=2975959 RepID=UPI002E0F0578|nr:PLP-dependent aminotransferase family protein [Dactylosporangium sp. NBC_01737]